MSSEVSTLKPNAVRERSWSRLSKKSLKLSLSKAWTKWNKSKVAAPPSDATVSSPTKIKNVSLASRKVKSEMQTSSTDRKVVFLGRVLRSSRLRRVPIVCLLRALPFQIGFTDKNLVSRKIRSIRSPKHSSSKDSSWFHQAWKSTCVDISGKMIDHQANGNCVFYGLYESNGKNEVLRKSDAEGGVDITVRNLRRLIIDSQLKELRDLCKTAGVNADKLLATIGDACSESGIKSVTMAAYDILVANKSDLLVKCCKKYNKNLRRNDRIVTIPNIQGNATDAFIFSEKFKGQITHLMQIALDIVLKDRGGQGASVRGKKQPYSYMDTSALKHVANMIEKPVILVDVEKTQSIPGVYDDSERDDDGVNRVCGLTFYYPDGKSLRKELMTVSRLNAEIENFEKTEGNEYIIIAKTGNHFFGTPSFQSNNLYAWANPMSWNVEMRRFRSEVVPAQASPALSSEFSNSFLGDPFDSSYNVVSVSGTRTSAMKLDLSDNKKLSQIKAFEDVQKRLCLYHESPTEDGVFKKIFVHGGRGIGKILCECLLQIGFLDRGLECVATDVVAQQESINPIKRALDQITAAVVAIGPGGDAESGAGKAEAPPNARVDAWFKLNVRVQELEEKSKQPSFPACVLAEMQTTECAMAVRLLAYACAIFFRAKINLSANPVIIPPRVYAYAFCMWKPWNTRIVEQKSISTDKIDGDGKDKSASKSRPMTELLVGNIYLGPRVEAKLDTKNLKLENREATLSEAEEELAKQVIALADKHEDGLDSSSDASDSASEQPKSAITKLVSMKAKYKELFLLLSFIKLAHLRTATDVNSLLQKIKPRKSFADALRAAYKIIQIKDLTMEQIKTDSPGLYTTIQLGLQDALTQGQEAKAVLSQVQAAFANLEEKDFRALPLELQGISKLLLPTTSLEKRSSSLSDTSGIDDEVGSFSGEIGSAVESEEVGHSEHKTIKPAKRKRRKGMKEKHKAQKQKDGTTRSARVKGKTAVAKTREKA